MLIRPITPRDRQLLADEWTALLPPIQRDRFGDLYANVTLLAYTDDGQCLLGAAQYIRRADDPQTAEMVLVVAQTEVWERAGRALAEQLRDTAHRNGIGRFCAPQPEAAWLLTDLAA
jgi:hypothetical protein